MIEKIDLVKMDASFNIQNLKQIFHKVVRQDQHAFSNFLF